METRYAPIEQFETVEELEAEHQTLARRGTALVLRLARLNGENRLRQALAEKYPEEAALVNAEWMDTFAYAAYDLATQAGNKLSLKLGLKTGAFNLAKVIVSIATKHPEMFSAEQMVKDLENAPAVWRARLDAAVILDVGYLCLLDACNEVDNWYREAMHNMTMLLDMRGLMPTHEELEAEEQKRQEESGLPEELRELLKLMRAGGTEIHVAEIEMDDL